MASHLTVALTGGSGFVGRHILAQLTAAGHRARVLARSTSRLSPVAQGAGTPSGGGGVQVVEGSLFDDRALEQLSEGADAVIHLVGIIMENERRGQTFERIHTEATARFLDAAKHAGVGRWIHMSALGARPAAVSRYHQTKWQAESLVRQSGMKYTIFRPSIIHGPDGEFMQLVKDFWCKPFPPFVPFFTAGPWLRDSLAIKATVLWPFPSLKKPYEDGRYISNAPAGRLQPIWVDDVAQCFVAALTNDKTVNETYPMGGPDAYTWPRLYASVRNHLPNARNKKIAAVPVWYANAVANMPGVPFNKDQVTMSQEDSVCDIGKVQGDFDIELAGFEAKLAEYAGRIN